MKNTERCIELSQWLLIIIIVYFTIVMITKLIIIKFFLKKNNHNKLFPKVKREKIISMLREKIDLLQKMLFLWESTIRP